MGVERRTRSYRQIELEKHHHAGFEGNVTRTVVGCEPDTLVCVFSSVSNVRFVLYKYSTRLLYLVF